MFNFYYINLFKFKKNTTYIHLKNGNLAISVIFK